MIIVTHLVTHRHVRHAKDGQADEENAGPAQEINKIVELAVVG